MNFAGAEYYGADETGGTGAEDYAHHEDGSHYYLQGEGYEGGGYEGYEDDGTMGFDPSQFDNNFYDPSAYADLSMDASGGNFTYPGSRRGAGKMGYGNMRFGGPMMQNHRGGQPNRQTRGGRGSNNSHLPYFGSAGAGMGAGPRGMMNPMMMMPNMMPPMMPRNGRMKQPHLIPPPLPPPIPPPPGMGPLPPLPPPPFFPFPPMVAPQPQPQQQRRGFGSMGHTQQRGAKGIGMGMGVSAADNGMGTAADALGGDSTGGAPAPTPTLAPFNLSARSAPFIPANRMASASSTTGTSAAGTLPGATHAAAAEPTTHTAPTNSSPPPTTTTTVTHTGAGPLGEKKEPTLMDNMIVPEDLDATIMSASSSGSSKSEMALHFYDPVVLPQCLQGYVRYVVVLDPADNCPYSIGIRHVCRSKGATDILNRLSGNVPRRHKKRVHGILCRSVAENRICPMHFECSEIHVTPVGYSRRRQWTQVLGPTPRRGGDGMDMDEYGDDDDAEFLALHDEHHEMHGGDEHQHYPPYPHHHQQPPYQPYPASAIHHPHYHPHYSGAEHMAHEAFVPQPAVPPSSSQGLDNVIMDMISEGLTSLRTENGKAPIPLTELLSNAPSASMQPPLNDPRAALLHSHQQHPPGRAPGTLSPDLLHAHNLNTPAGLLSKESLSHLANSAVAAVSHLARENEPLLPPSASSKSGLSLFNLGGWAIEPPAPPPPPPPPATTLTYFAPGPINTTEWLAEICLTPASPKTEDQMEKCYHTSSQTGSVLSSSERERVLQTVNMSVPIGDEYFAAFLIATGVDLVQSAPFETFANPNESSSKPNPVAEPPVQAEGGGATGRLQSPDNTLSEVGISPAPSPLSGDVKRPVETAAPVAEHDESRTVQN